MNLLDSILNSQNGAAVQNLGSQLGLGQDQTTAALSAIVPALAAGLHQSAQTPDGLSGLMAALTGGNHQQYVDNPATLGHPDSISDGNAILGHMFGSKDVSRGVASQASAQTGISEDVLKKMLPMAAALVMGAMARHATQGPSAGAMRGQTASIGPSGGGGDLINMITSTLSQGGGAGAQGGGIDIGGLLGRFLGR